MEIAVTSLIRTFYASTVLFLLTSSPCLVAADVIKPELAKPGTDGTLLWYDIGHLEIEGKGWTQSCRVCQVFTQTHRLVVYVVNEDNWCVCGVP